MVCTLFSYGDVLANNPRETLFSCLAMVLGIAIYFGMLLGGLTSIMTNSDKRRGLFLHRFLVIKQFLVLSFLSAF